ncbi:MAG: cell division protein FtsW [Rickettsiales bacterium]|nr:cell division protein FtsW [Rickettsiales bacterium]OUV53159.1 MAG: hypothetical protein CBC87_04625 [Rickettsiales bacterium TMED127]|tara:strand:+ start:10376 stop:11476 length:1101 start_codon:yes stop_codon:yes gene_type:complete
MDRNLKFKTWWTSLDKVILLSTLVLLFFGTILIYSSSLYFEERNNVSSNFLIKKHLFFIPLAVLTIISCSILSLRNLIVVSFVFFLIFLVLSFLPPFLNVEIKGAKRWIKIFNISIQPSEFLKPTFLIISSLLLTRFNKIKDYSFNLNIFFFLILTISFLFQPDFGMLMLIFIAWFLQIILSGASLLIIFLFVLFGILISVFAFFNFAHVRFRVENFFLGNISDNFQINKSVDAISNGGLLGEGLGQAEISKNLPDVHTDFIFALAGEELGFLFLMILISCYLMIFGRVLIFAFKEKNLFIFLASSGLIFIFIFQVMINISSSLNLIPTKGMTLPFISYGGSSLISSSFLIGSLLCLTKIRQYNEK